MPDTSRERGVLISSPARRSPRAAEKRDGITGKIIIRERKELFFSRLFHRGCVVICILWQRLTRQNAVPPRSPDNPENGDFIECRRRNGNAKGQALSGRDSFISARGDGLRATLPSPRAAAPHVLITSAPANRRAISCYTIYVFRSRSSGRRDPMASLILGRSFNAAVCLTLSSVNLIDRKRTFCV